VLRLLTLLRRPWLLCVELAAGQASARQTRSRPAAVAARLARLPAVGLARALAVTRARLAPAWLSLVPAVASCPVTSWPGRPLAAWGRRRVARRRGLGDRGGRVVPVPVLASAAGLLLAGLLVLAGDERLGLLGQLRLGLGAPRG
jgi:hypothetical protein